jgi:hypothetical protein
VEDCLTHRTSVAHAPKPDKTRETGRKPRREIQRRERLISRGKEIVNDERSGYNATVDERRRSSEIAASCHPEWMMHSVADGSWGPS